MKKRTQTGYQRWSLLLLLFLPWANASATSPIFDVDHGKYPYYPSLIQYQSSQAEFTPPEVCADCHQKQYQEWIGSVHAMAFKDPVYQGELNLAVQKVGHEIARQCEGCHSPAGMVTGEIKGPGNQGLSSMALAGVSCDICHSIVDTSHWQTPAHEPENGSFVIRPGVDTENGPELRKRGPFPPSEDCGMGFHVCEESSLHLQADLCAGCHQVYHYEAHFPLEASYLEWKHGPYPQKAILCQDCHMVDYNTFIRSADDFRKPERHEYRHYFNGANYLLYYLAAGAAEKTGDKELAENLRKKYELAVARLQAAAELEISPIYRGGQLREIKVRVKNIRAGHNLPTSLTNIRQMWLEITVRDETGQLLLTSGAIDAAGHLPENTRIFNSDGMGSDFHFAVDPWVITSFSRHETIPPKGYKDVYYGINPLQTPVVKIEARLRYRQADQKIAEKLLSNVPEDINLQEIYGLTEVPPLPVVDMVASEVRFNTRQ
jgi:hypothetical protein